MESSEALIDRLVTTAQQLPTEKKEQLLDFAEYLLARDQLAHSASATHTDDDVLDPAKNPLHKLAGIASIGGLSTDIDNVVYDL
jgi:hypothetical protein